MNAKTLLQFLLDLEANGQNLSLIKVNYRHNDNADVEPVKAVWEDLYHPNTSQLRSIVLVTDPNPS